MTSIQTHETIQTHGLSEHMPQSSQSQTAPSGKNKSLWIAMRIAVSMLVLWFMFTRIDVASFFAVLVHINLWLALGGFFVGIITVYLSSWQWQVLLQKENISLPYWLTTMLYFIGITFNQLLPSSIGGDVVKATYVARISKEGVQSASATFMARFIGLAALLLTSLPVAGFALLQGLPKAGELFLFLFLIAVAYTGMFILLLYNQAILKRFHIAHMPRLPFNKKLSQLSETLSSYQQYPVLLLRAAGISGLFYIASYINFYVYGLALGITIPFWFYWIAVPISALVTMLPISLNGYGVRGASFVGLFAIMHVAAAQSLSVSTVMEIQMILLAVIGAVCIPSVNRQISSASATSTTTMTNIARKTPIFSVGGNTMFSFQKSEFITPSRALVGTFFIFVMVLAPLTAQRLFKGTPKVTVFTASTNAINVLVGGGGIVFPKQTLNVTYPVSAQVLSVDVSVGESVTAGQSLITLDSASLNAQLQLAYQQLQVAVDYYNTLANQGALQSQLASAQSAAQIAQSKYDTLNTQIHSPSYNGGHITSNFAGVVTQINGVPGTLFKAGDTLLVLQDISSYIIQAEFPISQAAMIATNAVADIYPDNSPQTASGGNTPYYTGSVLAVNPQLSSDGSNTFTVWIALPNLQQIIFLGESVFVQIHKTVLMLSIPKMSVLYDGNNAYVFVYSKGHAHIRQVTTGVNDIAMIGISSGLVAGDQVIEAGQYQLTDNQSVQVK